MVHLGQLGAREGVGNKFFTSFSDPNIHPHARQSLRLLEKYAFCGRILDGFPSSKSQVTTSALAASCAPKSLRTDFGSVGNMPPSIGFHVSQLPCAEKIESWKLSTAEIWRFFLVVEKTGKTLLKIARAELLLVPLDRQTQHFQY